MQIRKINDNTIICVITQEDLRENEIDLDDLLEHKPRAMKYLRGIIMEAAEKEDFHIEGPFTTMQVRVLQDNSICLTLSQGLQPELVHELRQLGERLMHGRKEEQALEQTDEGQAGEVPAPSSEAPAAAEEGPEKDSPAEEQVCGFAFDDMCDVIDCCRHVPELASVRTSLYWDEPDKSYYLFLCPQDDASQFEKILLSMNEFGTMLEIPSGEAAYIAEHDVCILKENAAQTLTELH